jgi:glycosyltransferase involved in cell wall biosynthesis
MPARTARDRVVVALAVHPEELAATRLRVQQYEPFLRADGFTLRTWSFLRKRDLADWYGRSQLRRAWVLLRALLRLPAVWLVLRDAGTVLVQREALPLGPPLLELAAARHRKMVWDVDDSMWVPYVSPTAGRVPRWLRAPADKFGTLCRRADEVWAGSEVLARWCRASNPSVMVLPTVVDVPRALAPRALTRTVAWVGSHSTSEFIEGLLPALRDVQPPLRVLIVGASPAVPTGLDCEVRPWTPENEAWALRESALGVYPVDASHPLAEGKCGLKAVLFMSVGVPVVVTPTTTNATIVRDGVDGLHADAPADWTRAVERILGDEALWESMRSAAHERALLGYSLETWAPVVVDHLRHLDDVADPKTSAGGDR